MMTEDNWNYTYYESNNLKASIGCGLSPENPNELTYFFNITDENGNDLYQKPFASCAAASHFINRKYSHIWSFGSLEEVSSGSGCSTCVAH